MKFNQLVVNIEKEIVRLRRKEKEASKMDNPFSRLVSLVFNSQAGSLERIIKNEPN